MVEKSEIIAIGCDHAGFRMKEFLKERVGTWGYTVSDFGTGSEESVDYPDIIHPIAAKVNSGELKLAIILCGSGNGVSMVANKYPGVRAALCWTSEIASFARRHNDANILALPARFVTEPEAEEIVRTFLETDFEGGRHQRRVEKIAPSL